MLSLPLILFGGLFTVAVAYSLGLFCLRALPVPRVIALAIGAAVESSLVFLLLLVGAAKTLVFGVLGAIALLPLVWVRGIRLEDPVVKPVEGHAKYLLMTIFACYGVLYLIHALAPEIQPDGVGYHLGLVAEYYHLRRFPHTVSFFEMLPQGLEMLFLFAFAFGKHSAAKLVHFAFLLATVPLLCRVGRRLGLGDMISLSAAAIYFCAPVVGVTGTSSYNDAALVFFVLASFYLLLVWKQQQDDRYLVPAGLLAGFCYAVKFPGILLLPLAALFVIVERRKQPGQWIRLFTLLSGGLLMIAPWMLRDAIMSGNPLAPLFNRWFPNPYFHVSMERYLAHTLASYGGFHYRDALYDLAVGGRLQGVFGLLFIAFPLGLLALRRRVGRLCWVVAAALAIPWFSNVGARFLMPSLPFLALAFVMVLPRPAMLACVLFQAVTCWPQFMGLYSNRDVWRLHGIPLQAALRIEPETNYLQHNLEYFQVAQMVNAGTNSEQRIFSLFTAPTAYIQRPVDEFWHSATADNLLDALKVAGFSLRDPFYDVRATWPARSLRAVRFRLSEAYPAEWDIQEIRLFDGKRRISVDSRWQLTAWPNLWDATLALDGNLATAWRTWDPMRPGMFLEVDLDRPQLITGATLVSHTPVYMVPLQVFGQSVDGRWHLLADNPPAILRKQHDLRYAAMGALRHAGYTYLLTTAGSDGLGPLGKTMVGHEADWGIKRVGEINGVYLFRIL